MYRFEENIKTDNRILMKPDCYQNMKQLVILCHLPNVHRHCCVCPIPLYTYILRIAQEHDVCTSQESRRILITNIVSPIHELVKFQKRSNEKLEIIKYQHKILTSSAIFLKKLTSHPSTIIILLFSLGRYNCCKTGRTGGFLFWR